MFDDFEHYLSFGSTDQETLRVVEGEYSGLLVPGTVAALQREGTGGFLLALSAATARTRYVIDPRSPIFQQPLPAVKKSFEVLAGIFREVSPVVAGVVPSPNDFTDARVDAMAAGWVAFNEGYLDRSGGKFDKYAKKLNQEVRPADAQGPEAILAPYFVAESDAWWDVSRRLYAATAAAATRLPVVPIVATEKPEELAGRAADLDVARLGVWASGLDELKASVPSLLAYAENIRAVSAQRKRIFALYGGYFSIILCSRGLSGFSHGIGYGDNREWRELPQSGPPAPRYYLPFAHRYAAREVAQRLYGIDPDLVRCGCRVCSGRPPLSLTYHELMQHSVLCRSSEVRSRPGEDLARTATQLERSHDALLAAAEDKSVRGTPVARRIQDLGAHLSRWSESLAGL